ncbi:hypothetical protein EBA01_01335 [Xanthomonas oryzae pv. oryzae]|nr:hypothetical protein BVV16_01365 [Xanthomonas oryzae pv. oryzae]AUI92870.1 hypothetical protein BVV17_01365 [Xanthomonas oryzae pv. oryzae]AUI96543.1 hypothetical protein BVV18_01370 [Xanthomonas oryzae pv. oryzae]AUJ00214.1 hypothetical protein BVV10_01365 [Xanthomonas oryzae pv. oryzae]AUJ03893.1 hypothetical protein BVV19_01370 [Xanthomonas oryzae pv. oryzae]
MICSSEKRFFTSNLLGIGNWTPNRCATQTRGDVGLTVVPARLNASLGTPLSATPTHPSTTATGVRSGSENETGGTRRVMANAARPSNTITTGGGILVSS